jgi:hypothetical protein
MSTGLMERRWRMSALICSCDAMPVMRASHAACCTCCQPTAQCIIPVKADDDCEVAILVLGAKTPLATDKTVAGKINVGLTTHQKNERHIRQSQVVF